MLTLNQISEKLKDRRLDKVADATGVHRNTVQAIRDGKQSNPKYITLKALSDYLEERP